MSMMKTESILAVRIQQLIASCATPLESGPCKITSRKLSHWKKDLSSIHVRDLLRCHTTGTSGVCEVCAQASETSVADHSKRPPKTEGSFTKRPSMSKIFKSMTHDEMISTLSL